MIHLIGSTVSVFYGKILSTSSMKSLPCRHTINIFAAYWIQKFGSKAEPETNFAQCTNIMGLFLLKQTENVYLYYRT